jgi:hypothetical protein
MGFRTRTAVCAVALLGLMPAGQAFGHVTADASAVSVRYIEDIESFKGRVSSTENDCVRGRTIKLFKETSDGRTLVGTTTTGRHGRFKLKEANANGTYRARVARRETGGMGHRHICQRAESGTVAVNP